MGGGAKNQKVEQTSEPWEGQEEPLRRLYSRAEQAFQETPRDPYLGPLIARNNENQRAARYDLLQDAAAFGNAPGQRIMDLANRTMGGDFLHPETNPFLSRTIQAAINPVQERYQEQIIPQMLSEAIDNGAYGGSRNGQILANAGQNFAREALDVTGRIGYENYNAERNRQMQAPQMYQQGFQLSTLPEQMRMQIGDLERADEQQILDEAFERWEMARAAPWAGLAEFGGAITSGSPGATTTQRRTGGASGGGIGGGIQGAMGGAMLGNSIAPLLGLAGPWGMAAGAALGLAGGILG